MPSRAGPSAGSLDLIRARPVCRRADVELLRRGLREAVANAAAGDPAACAEALARQAALGVAAAAPRLVAVRGWSSSCSDCGGCGPRGGCRQTAAEQQVGAQ